MQGSYFSDNENVAAITGLGFVSLVAPGETSVMTTLDFWGVDPNCFVCPPEGGCTYQWASSFNPVRVLPTVSISGPANVPLRGPGSSGPNSVQLMATGNPGGGTFHWSTSSTKVVLTNTTSATVTVTSQSESGAPNDVPIQVTYTVNNQSSTAIGFLTVQKPTSLFRVSDTGSVQDFECLVFNLDYLGVRRDVLYQVRDQWDRPILFANMLAEETFAPVSNTCAGVPDTPTSSNGFTLGDGTFNGVDRHALCSSSCLPADANRQPVGSCSLKFRQFWKINGILVPTIQVEDTCTSVSLGP